MINIYQVQDIIFCNKNIEGGYSLYLCIDADLQCYILYNPLYNKPAFTYMYTSIGVPLLYLP